MKKIYILGLTLFLFSVFFVCSSCSDFLEKAPTTELSSQTFWQTQSDADLALTGVYSTLRSTPLGRSRFAVLDALTDNGWSQYNGDDGKIQEIANGVITPLTGGIISEMWNDNYRAIAHCNIFLQNINRVSISDDIKKVYIGEVRFIRSLYYFMLTQFFGDVPIVLEPLTIETMKIPRSPYEKVLEIIYDDLDYAITNLPDIFYNGHVVKSAALALKARILLFNGNYKESAELSKQIIDGKLYSIFNKDEYSYLKLFSCDGDQKDNCEIIFSVRHLRPNVTSDIQTRMGRFTAVSPLDNFINEFEKGDLRKKLILMDAVENTWWPCGEALGTPSFEANLWQSPMGCGIRKWSPIKWDLIEANHDPHIPLIRYAEVLLNYAEAKNEFDGPDQSVYDAINLIRGRAQLAPLRAGLTKDEMRKIIRHERRIELCFEGQRWMDLKRWKIAGEVIPKIPINFKEPLGSKRIWKDSFYYWPIQQGELDKDPEHLQQTEGY